VTVHTVYSCVASTTVHQARFLSAMSVASDAPRGARHSYRPGHA